MCVYFIRCGRVVHDVGRVVSRQTPDSIGAKLLIASTALRAYRNRNHACLLKIASIHLLLSVLISRGSAKLLLALLVKTLKHVRLRSQTSLEGKQKKTLLWLERNKKPVHCLSAVTDEEGHPLGKRRGIR